MTYRDALKQAALEAGYTVEQVEDITNMADEHDVQATHAANKEIPPEDEEAWLAQAKVFLATVARLPKELTVVLAAHMEAERQRNYRNN